MWLIDNLIAMWFQKRRDHERMARVRSKQTTACRPSGALDVGLHSRHFTLRSDCSHQEAIAEIEDCLRGKRSQGEDRAHESFLLDRRGVI